MIFSVIQYAAAWVGGYLSAAAGLSFQTAVSIGTWAGNIAAAAAAIGISRALTPKVNIPVSEVQAVINQSDAPRRVYVGKNLAGGIRAFFHARNGTLYQLVVVNHGEIHSFDEFRIDGEPVTIGSGGVVSSGPSASYVRVSTRNGFALGGDYQPLRDAFSTVWTTQRRLEKQATFLVRCNAPKAEDFAKVFPKGYNTVFQWVIRGQKVYDPRIESSVYSDNAALVITHFLRHGDGYRLSWGECHWPSIIAMANVSDQPVPQKSGGTAPNLRLWGYWTLDEEPVAVLDRMHTSSGIRAYETQDGRIGLIGGDYGDTACTLTAKDIRSIKTVEAISEREGYNVLKPFFMSEAQKFEITELEPWVDDARLAQEGEIAQELRMEMCPNQSQARRLAKRQIHDDNRAKVEIVTNLVGLKARYPAKHGQRHTIMLDYRPEDGSGRVIAGEYEVLDHEFDPVGLECRIELARVDRGSEAWDPSEEGEIITTPDDIALSPPPPLTGVVVSQRIIRPTETQRQAIIEVEAPAISGRDDLELQARYRRVFLGSPWLGMTTLGLTAQTGVLEDGEMYEVEARWRGSFDGVAPWVSLGKITIVVNSTPPAAPTELIPSLGSGYVHLSWRNPAGEFANIRVYRSETPGIETAALIGSTGGVSGQISEYQDDTIAAATTYHYWVVAANESGVESTAAGPATITT